MTTQLGAPGAAHEVPPGYTLGRLLGRGGSGTVYEARQHSTGRTVALKLLDVDVAGPEVLRRFSRERSAMGGLAGHPHIVSIIDAGLHAGRPWLTMDLCSGGSLADVAEPMPVAQVVSLLHTVGSALAVAHAHGVLHCDVKPGNILLTAYGQPALSDFGIARMTLESQGSRIGGYTLDHVPPEILRGERPSDRGDLWSLGTTAWQLLEGRPPFRQTDDVAAVTVMRRIENEPLPPMRRPDLPSGLRTLIQEMTVKDPTRRPSAADVSRRAGELAHADGLPLGVPLPLPGRRPATATWSGPSLPPQVSAPSISGPPSPRVPHRDEDAVTGRIPLPAGPPPVPGRSASGPLPGTLGAPPSYPPPGPAPEPPRRPRRWGRVLAGLAVLTVLAMIGGGFLTYRYGPTRTVSAPPTTVTVTAAPTSVATPAPGAAPAPAAPVSGIPPLFLGQVQEVSATSGLTKQGYGINGTFYPLSINVATYTSSSPEPSGIDYLLNRQYRTFSTTFGIADTFSDLGSTNATPPSCTLQVLLDDRPLTSIQTATRQTPLQLQNLDVSGGLRLRLVMTQTGTSGSSSSSSGSTSYPCTLGNPVVAG